MSAGASNLIVPISLQGLVVGAGDTQKVCFTDPDADFSHYPYLNANWQVENPCAPISENVLNPPFESNTALPSGVHLHWALPDALTHGYHNPADNTAVFPDAPNRWLVTRIWQGDDGLKVLSWVIESNYLSTTSQRNNVTVPVLYNGNQNGPTYRYLGQFYPLDQWQEKESTAPAGTYLPHLTAIGYGNSSFAARYPNCRSVFGFYDDLSDLSAATSLTYVVTGWYAGAATDPINPAWVANILALNRKIPTNDPVADLLKVLAIYKWSFADGTDCSALTQTLCGGVLLSVQWDPAPKKSYLDDSAVNDLTIAVGNSPTEALSALLANQLGSTSYGDVEQFLNAFQAGILPQLAKPDGLSQLEELLHQSSFEQHDGGSVWILQRQQMPSDPTVDPSDPPPPEPDENAIPASYGLALDQLNQLQSQFDVATDVLASTRREIFWNWYKYMVVEHDPASSSGPPTNYPDVNTIHDYLAQWVGDPDNPTQSFKVADQEANLATLQTSIQTAQSSIGSQLIADKLPFNLVETAGPRFWRPVDPSFLFSGPDVQLPSRGGRYLNADGTLSCRTDAQLISSVSTAGGNVLPDCPPLYTTPPAEGPFTMLSALCQEASIFRTLYLQNTDFQALLKTLASVPAPSQAPSPLEITVWETPWSPFIIEWEMRYVPTGGEQTKAGVSIPYAPEYVHSSYQFDPDNNQYNYTGANPNPLAFTTYRGSVIITPATVNLQSQIANYLKVNPDPELQAVLTQLQSLPLLAQNISGVNDALLMRKLTMQMAIADPIPASPSLQTFTNTNCANAIGQMNNTAPLPDNIFCGLRAGFATLSQLRFIDSFGRFKTVNPSALTPAESLRAPSSLPARYFAMPPRVTQPARLAFRYLSADSRMVEMNSVTASSPICGWIVPNYLDQTLLVCGTQGESIAFLAHAPDGKTIQCYPAPGSSNQDPTIPGLFQGKNPYLQTMVEGICGNAPAFFDTLLENFNLALGRIDPQSYQSNQSVSILLGRPLAVVRATLKLEVQGNPATDQSWSAFAKLVDPSWGPADPSDGFTTVQFPVQVGEFGKLNDGLVGYFMEGSLTSFETFYTAVPGVSQDGIVPTGEELLVSADPQADVITLTMVIDPRAKVHAKSAIFPTKSLDIPAYQYADALKFLEVTFTARPMLLREDQISVPLPKEAGGQWSWLERNGDTWKTVEKLVDSTDRATLFPTGQVIRDGWLQLQSNP